MCHAPLRDKEIKNLLCKCKALHRKEFISGKDRDRLYQINLKHSIVYLGAN